MEFGLVIGAANSSGVSGTLIVAIVALAVSTSSLTSQVAQHLLTGARVTVHLNVGAYNGSGVIYCPVTKTFDWSGAIQQGYREPVVVLVPYRLEPGAEVTWIAPTNPLQVAWL